MTTGQGELDQLWEALLSRDPGRIRRAWQDLSDDEAQAVLAHLARMRDDEGWQPDQRAAAAAALRTIQESAQ
jgi:cytochrome c553